jgi:hypothetical protein
MLADLQIEYSTGLKQQTSCQRAVRAAVRTLMAVVPMSAACLQTCAPGAPECLVFAANSSAI